jgi:hypothetical protein
MREFKCEVCEETFHYADEVIFDGDELKVVDEHYPDWDTCVCVECAYDGKFEDETYEEETE